ncbi:Bug family tripartite tricarboxylate transporter substrate binding protein [Cupriavidus oxalaticus]|uniref:Extra-cytoplasmic solute receptor n=1 Tax=Cupriavidus oxalaticus TaxID=96344 RepID=A0A375FR53_9BURK|nr:tripartite tricarboxylate transporter substrate binding protein [Cupriavidus oxalaticus]QRQ85442.1 tripartite tricarboxylate transporter substrate binding protein [Cupriavidus oxalaticus]QRQ90470.1 tripartite tricarboxylate transporter substrate binding protein [Cupriavidus oxalaticus]WQD84988.1 tripartite tricarboxylate transporter substrate binding protein [Cupriavidus oxalaticus]SPC08332.1 Extra-cytoplasmic solute receptor [Cupriavidus oxalaticus]SPC24241.1 Extra-cytoplasmic solute recep
MIHRIRLRTVACAMLPMLAAAISPGNAAAASAGGYPEKAVRVIVPFPAGSGTDNSARFIGERITAQTGKPIVVDNRPGANGFIAAKAAATAASDGYTMLVTTNTTHAANASLFKKLPYDPVKDFAPASLIAKSGLVLVVPPDSPVRTLADLTALARSRQGQLTFASGSSSTRIASELYKMMAGVQALHVPYKGVPLALTDLMGHQVDFMISDISPALTLIQGGKLRAVAVTTAQRNPVLRDVPTMAESGLPGYEMVAWSAAFFPAGTPAPVVERMSRLIAKGLDGPAATDYFARTGSQPASSTPEELAAFVRSETQKWAKVIKAAGIEPE